MKNILISSLFFFSLLFVGCDKDEGNKDPNTIGGDVNVPFNVVGNTVSTSVKVGSNYVDIGDSIKIIKTENGISTLSVKADLTKNPTLKKFNDCIPDDYKDASGKLNCTIKIKVTSEGIQDLIKGDKPHTIIKYDCNVGDKYDLNYNGKIISRVVKAKSTTDDFPYGFYYIKTTTVEQPSVIPGIQKYIYKVNHKFGLVFMSIVLEDNSSIDSYIYPSKFE